MASIFWGLNVTVTKALLPEWMTPQGVIVVRLVGGCLLFWLTSMFFRTERIVRGDWLKLISGGVIGLFGFIYLFVRSLDYANPIDVSIIMTLPPMFVVLIGILFRRQRPGLLEVIGLVAAIGGAVLVIADGSSGKAGSDNMLGDLLAVASALCYALYLVILEKPTKTYRPLTMLRWVFLFSALPALVLLPGFADMSIMHSSAPVPWIEIAFILLCPTFLAYFLVQPAMRRIGSELVSVYQYLVPVFATVSAVLMRLDRLRPMQVVAMVIIVAGMLMINKGRRR